MPRYPRTFVLGCPHHIVQRGHNRNPIFATPGDYGFYLDNLNEQKHKLGVEVLAYCLMTNHVHLILRPTHHENSVSEFMRVLAARHTRYTNKLEARSGTLWDGRFKCSLIDTATYLLACCGYIDLNPVRAQIVTDPKDYAWSSYRALAGFGPTDVVDREVVYRLLELNSEHAAEIYRAYVRQGVTQSELTMIRSAVQRNQLTGASRFVDVVEAKVGRRIENRDRGRPRK
jgi:putative transposase